MHKASLFSAAVLLCAGASSAATYQWDVNGSSAGLGGTGTWTATSTYWDLVGTGGDTGTDATAALALSQGSNTIQVGGSTASSLTLSGTSRVSGVVFTGADGQTLSTSATATTVLEIMSGGVTANASATIGGSGYVYLYENQDWFVANGKTLNLTANIWAPYTYGGGPVLGFRKTGAGTLNVSGAFDFDGTVTISQGTLNFSGDWQSGELVNNGEFVWQASANKTFAGPISGTGSLVMSAGYTTLTLTGANSYSGATTINAGTLKLGSADALGNTSSIVFGGGILLHSVSNSTDYSSRFSTAANQKYSVSVDYLQSITWGTSLVSQGGTLSVRGSGSLVLGAANSYTGGTTIDGGRLVLGAAGALPTGGTVNIVNQGNLSLGGYNATVGAVTVSNGSISGQGTLTASSVTVDNPYWNVAISSKLAGAGTLSKTGAMSLELSGDNTYSGGTTMSGGTLNIGSDSALGTGTLTMSSGTLSSSSVAARAISNAVVFSGASTLGNATNNGQLTLSGGVGLGGATRTLTIDSTVEISGTVHSGSLVKSGASQLILSGANTYAGGTTVSQGAIRIGNNAALGTGLVTLSGGSLSSNSTAARTISNSLLLTSGTGLGSSVQSMAGDLTFSGAVSLGGATRTLTVNSSVTLSGTISNGGLTKLGSGVLTLSGSNSYSGNTSVSAGTLVVNGTTGTGTTTIAKAGTLKGTGTIAGAAVITGTHAPGNSPGVQTFASNLTYSNLADIEWELSANTSSNQPVAFDQVVVGGNLSFGLGVGMRLVFDPAGSSVNWTNAYWNQNHSWLVFDVAGTTSGIESVYAYSVTWADASGSMLDTLRPASLFSLSLSGSDVYLNYTAGALATPAVPEPSTYGLTLGALAFAAAWGRRRRLDREA